MDFTDITKISNFVDISNFVENILILKILFREWILFRCEHFARLRTNDDDDFIEWSSNRLIVGSKTNGSDLILSSMIRNSLPEIQNNVCFHRFRIAWTVKFYFDVFDWYLILPDSIVENRPDVVEILEDVLVELIVVIIMVYLGDIEMRLKLLTTFIVGRRCRILIRLTVILDATDFYNNYLFIESPNTIIGDSNIYYWFLEKCVAILGHVSRFISNTVAWFLVVLIDFIFFNFVTNFSYNMLILFFSFMPDLTSCFFVDYVDALFEFVHVLICFGIRWMM